MNQSDHSFSLLFSNCVWADIEWENSTKKETATLWWRKKEEEITADSHISRSNWCDVEMRWRPDANNTPIMFIQFYSHFRRFSVPFVASATPNHISKKKYNLEIKKIVVTYTSQDVYVFIFICERHSDFDRIGYKISKRQIACAEFDSIYWID